MREVLDGLAARLACRHYDEELGAELASTIEGQRRALDPWDAQSYTLENIRFHRAIFDASDNEFVKAQLPIVAMTSQVFRPLELVDFDRAADAIEEHASILEAIAAGDDAEAERRARLHIRHTIESIERHPAR
jgi:DNA-binding GntR family transcriptional regulator